MSNLLLAELTEKIIKGYRLKRGQDFSVFLTAPLEELQNDAQILQKHFCGNHIDLCTIINGRSGRCSEDCKYCAQAGCHHTGIEEYDLLDKDTIIDNARANEQAGVNRFSIVTSGRTVTGKAFAHILDTYKQMHKELHIDLCASHGFLTAEQFHLLHQAGVSSYHHNIETSRRFFPHICTTHTYDDKIRTIKIAQAEGLCVCSGGIIGMGESWEDRLDMAVSLAELGIQSIPVNALMPIKGTPLENLPQLNAKDVLRTIAFFRFINPEANIRLAAGRKLLPGNGETALIGGASASITGNMLTTSGTTIHEDMQMLERLGLTNKEYCPVC
ncbi:biotin synthase BioB [Pectinatus cerevisiiphilus]|uniref:Biotin synthase n=1 Tax=Pectinatus cerevisiiphilus TaxID=86956 RepID=A0A4R3KFT4_9FIRM|nr:biotin synthase BioB [Pectinatus cerevisiiphilus]TCS81933.1 biotin synthase [Pectinatus cerevisiiphilus]